MVLSLHFDIFPRNIMHYMRITYIGFFSQSIGSFCQAIVSGFIILVAYELFYMAIV